MKLLKLKWFNYFLLVTLLNITLHICYLYMLLQAHDTLDHTANNIYSFEQALLLCKKEMIYRDAGVAVRQALSGNITDTEVGLHPEHYDRLDLDLDPSTAVFDRWRLYRIHHFAVVAEQWSDLSKQLAEALANIPCESPHIVIANLLTIRPVEMTGWRETLRYPQNLARNTAKAGCPSLYTMVPDSDMVPIPGMAASLATFLARPEQRQCEKCAYVVPVYEIKSTIGRDVMPTNKTELLLLVERYFARRFHQTVYLLNQLSSDLDRWEALPPKNETEVAFDVTKYLFKYEPIYVARAETPIFDERFIGFGMTRNTQTYEMFMAGYTFSVLNNLFLNHWGLQKRETRPHWRKMQHLLNNRLFRGFAKELTARYNKDPYNMLEKIEMPGFWGVKNATAENGIPDQALLSEIYQRDRVS